MRIDKKLIEILKGIRDRQYQRKINALEEKIKEYEDQILELNNGNIDDIIGKRIKSLYFTKYASMHEKFDYVAKMMRDVGKKVHPLIKQLKEYKEEMNE